MFLEHVDMFVDGCACSKCQPQSHLATCMRLDTHATSFSLLVFAACAAEVHDCTKDLQHIESLLFDDGGSAWL